MAGNEERVVRALKQVPCLSVVQDLKISCPYCGSDKIDVVYPLRHGHPLKGIVEMLGIAECKGCQKEFPVKLPQDLATVVYYRIFSCLDHSKLHELLDILGIGDLGLLH